MRGGESLRSARNSIGLGIAARLTRLIALLWILTTLAPILGKAGGLIYIEGSDKILATLDPTTGQIKVIGSTSVRLSGLGFGADGTLFGLGEDDNLYRVDPATADLTLVGPCPSSHSGGFAMGATPDGTLYVQANGAVSTLNPANGALTALGDLGFVTPSDINGDNEGNLYIIRDATHSLYRVDRATGAATLLGQGSYGSVYGLAACGGIMYAIEYSGTGIYSLDLTNGQSTLVAHYDQSIAGRIYTAAADFRNTPAAASRIFIEGSNDILATLDPTTGQIQKIGPTSVSLAGLGFGVDGTLFGLSEDDQLYRVDPATADLTVIGPCPVSHSGGFAMGATSDGTLYVQANGVVSIVNPANGALTALGDLGFVTPSDLNGDNEGNLYIIRDATRSLYRVDRATGAATLLGQGSYGSVYGLASCDGTMYAIEYSGTGIYSLDLTNGESTLVARYDQSIVGRIYTAAADFRGSSAPFLGISKLTPSTVLLTWPVRYGDFHLEFTDFLATSAWKAVTNAPTADQTLLNITLPVEGPQRYFRLRRP